MKFVFYRLVGVFCVLFGLVATGYAMPYTFDNDNQGWEQFFIGRPEGTTYDQLFESESADWDSDNGNPPGSIYQIAQGIDKRAYGMGYMEPNFLGNLTNRKLTVDLWSTNNWRTISDGEYGDDGDVYARWFISKVDGTASDGKPLVNMYVSKVAFSIDINEISGWETFSIEVKKENFFRWPNYDAQTMNFDELLREYDTIGLALLSGTDDISNLNGGEGTWNDDYQLVHYGAYSADGETAILALDNFDATPVPEPGTFLLLASGLGGVLFYRKKHG